MIQKEEKKTSEEKKRRRLLFSSLLLFKEEKKTSLQRREEDFSSLLFSLKPAPVHLICRLSGFNCQQCRSLSVWQRATGPLRVGLKLIFLLLIRRGRESEDRVAFDRRCILPSACLC
jgi:hypothetical protein